MALRTFKGRFNFKKGTTSFRSKGKTYVAENIAFVDHRTSPDDVAAELNELISHLGIEFIGIDEGSDQYGFICVKKGSV